MSSQWSRRPEPRAQLPVSYVATTNVGAERPRSRAQSSHRILTTLGTVGGAALIRVCDSRLHTRRARLKLLGHHPTLLRAECGRAVQGCPPVCVQFSDAVAVALITASSAIIVAVITGLATVIAAWLQSRGRPR
jgi:hypothetical protein